MDSHFLHLATTPAIADAQRRYYGRAAVDAAVPPPDELGPVERKFIGARDSFYLATVTESGWPYVQHRGGPAGFLRVLGPNRLGFADVRGNRQLLSTGNIAANDRVALFLMDYPQRSRLKILGHAKIVSAAEVRELAANSAVPGVGTVERWMKIDVVAFDWNCPKYITPRYTKAEVEAVVGPLRARIAELEAERDARRAG
jgi:predicted pyridoxine 5'-phosphate oxidase superfamily flavin-nucleotide-binding protein